MSPVVLYQKYAVVFPFGSPPVFAALLRSDVGGTLVIFNVVVFFFFFCSLCIRNSCLPPLKILLDLRRVPHPHFDTRVLHEMNSTFSRPLGIFHSNSPWYFSDHLFSESFAKDALLCFFLTPQHGSI